MLKQLAFVCVLPVISATSSPAQNINDLLSALNGVVQQTVRQAAQLEWGRLPPSELSRLDKNLEHQGAKINVLTIDASKIAESQSQSTTRISKWPESMLHWQTELAEVLSRGKRYPPDAISRGEQGTVLVGLILGRTGNLISSHIAKGSGSDLLDREALDLVSRVKGFPFLPSDYTEDTISVTVPIKFNFDKQPTPAVSHSNIDLSQPSQDPSDRPASACDTYAAYEFDSQRKTAGVPFNNINPSLAIPACESAIQQFPDDIRLNYQLGRAYHKANNFNLALAQYRKAADRNFPLAQFGLGYMYQNGQGVSQDYQQAVGWYRKAADQGHVVAQNNLGLMYRNGWGVPQDYQEALSWYQKAAEQKLSLAQYNLGSMYESGLGVTQDYQQAIGWYQKAADQGQKEAKAKIDEVKAKLGVLPTANSSSPTLEQTAAYIILSGDVDLSQMTTNSDGSVNTPFHNIFGSPFTVLPAAVTKVIDRPNCIVEVVMQAVQGMQPEKHMYFYFNRVSGFRDEEVYAARLGNFTRIWALSESPVFCASGGGTRLTGELIPENYSCITDAPLVGGIKPQNVERVHKALDYLYSQFCVYATKKSPF